MISLLTKPQNGNTTTQEMYRKRLEEVLGGVEETSECCPAESLCLPEATTASEEPAVSAAPGPDSTLADSPAQVAQDGKETSGDLELDQAARQIADTLVGTLGQAIRDVHRRVTTDHTRLETAAGTVLQLSGEIQQASTEVATLLTKVEALALEQTQFGSKFTGLDGRMSEEELGSKQTRERLDQLFAGEEATAHQVRACTSTLSALDARIVQLCQRLESLDASLQAQIATGARLNSFWEKLDQVSQSLAGRVESHEEMIQLLRSEVRQPVGMLERVLGSLRALDLRKETRYPVDEPVTVTIDGEPETVKAGRIVDASENGLGLTLESPLPSASIVRVEVNNSSLTGTVSYCHPNGEKHAVGVKLSQPLHGKGARQMK